MKLIQILGPGCEKCKRLSANVEAAVKALGIEAKIEKVDKVKDIMNLGVMITPGLVVDGEVKCSGKVLSTDEVKKILE